MYPKDGYRFKEADGTVIVGNSWSGVFARVRLYRKQNGLPPGDPEAEVHAQACARNPSLCVADDGGTTKRATQEVSLKGRVLKWFAEIRARKPGFVDEATAKARGAVCKQCPHNVGLPEGCANCRTVLTELRRDVLGSGHVIEDRLAHHGCTVLGCEPATAVHLDEVTVEDGALPAHCWRKRTL